MIPSETCRQENAEDGEECGPLAAFGCLRALSTVLDTVSSLPHLMPQVTAHIRESGLTWLLGHFLIDCKKMLPCGLRRAVQTCRVV